MDSHSHSTHDLLCLLREFDALLTGERKPEANNLYLRAHGARWRGAVSMNRLAAMQELKRRGALPEPYATELHDANAVLPKLLKGEGMRRTDGMKQREVTGSWAADVRYVAWVRDGEEWNGWAIPYFDKAEAEVVANDHNFRHHNDPEGHPGTFTWNGDVLIYRDGEITETIGEQGDAEQVYPIGAMAWCWEIAPCDHTRVAIGFLYPTTVHIVNGQVVYRYVDGDAQGIEGECLDCGRELTGEHAWHVVNDAEWPDDSQWQIPDVGKAEQKGLVRA